MNATIDNVLGTLRTALIDFFAGAENTIDRAEKFFADKISRAVTALMAAYYEKLDTELLADKKGRRKAGLVVERKNCKRELLTTLGYLEYKRTYYKKTADGCYAFPIDAIAGIEHYQRLSDCVSQNLVDAAKEMSYARSSNTVTAVSVYEGTDHIGKRGVCRNCWHRVTYDQKPDDFWEDTLNEIERRYDLTGTKIYLYGDGAAWIKKGLEWLPNSVFVLDRFHKNKALKNAVSGIEQKIGKQYERVFRMALNDDDRDLFQQATESLITQYPEREKTIRQNTDYLLENYEAIRICKTDPEAIRGGSTEPHVSHVLSARLSSRPMAWSKETLKHFVPILAAGQSRIVPKQPVEVLDIVKQKVAKHGGKPKFTAGLTDPRLAVKLPGKAGRVTPLFNALRQF